MSSVSYLLLAVGDSGPPVPTEPIGGPVGWHDMDGWDWVWMTTMMVVFWGGVAAVVIVLLRRTGPAHAPLQLTPEETLRGRLARGEIGVDEYHQRLSALEGPSPP